MTNRRETILAALFTSMQSMEQTTAEGIGFERNRPEPVDQNAMPIVLLYDGDESEASPELRAINRGSTALVVMHPELWGYVSAKPEDLGTAINSMRARLLASIFAADSAFTVAVGNDRVTIGPTTTGLGKSKKAIGGFSLPLSIAYSFDPRNP